MGDAEVEGRRGFGRTMTAMAMAMALVFGLIVPASAGGSSGERVGISGNAVPSACNQGHGAGAIELSGDLIGCLVFFPGDYSCTELNGFALYEEDGREIFDGTYAGEHGRFRTKYTLAATYTQGSCADIDAAILEGGEYPWGNQLTGGCDHKVYGTEGVFKGGRGLITFHDVIPEAGVSGASNFYYSGYLTA